MATFFSIKYSELFKDASENPSPALDDLPLKMLPLFWQRSAHQQKMVEGYKRDENALAKDV